MLFFCEQLKDAYKYESLTLKNPFTQIFIIKCLVPLFTMYLNNNVKTKSNIND